MEYTEERVRALARMARIAVGDGEVRALCNELNEMRAGVAILQSVGEAPDAFFGAVALETLREDAVGDCWSADAVLSLGGETASGCFSVPRAVEGN